MSTVSGNYVFDNSSLANFQSWANAIYQAFLTLGWTQTSDTGQTDPLSAGSVPSSTYLYFIFKAADTYASTLPIYVKVGYGFSSTAVEIQVTVGTGSNGSGTITGAPSSMPWTLNSGYTTNNGATTFPCYFSGNAGEFRMYMWQHSSGNLPGTIFGIERSKDSSGNETTSYFTAFSAQANGTASYFGNQQCVLSSSLYGNFDKAIITTPLTNGVGSGAFNGTVAAFPVLPILGYCGNPMLGLMSCCAADVADGSTVTVASLYGSTHTFIAASATGFSQACGYRGSSSGTAMALLMRYE